MILVCDINEIWRHRPFAALARQTEVLGVSPADWFVALRRKTPSSDAGINVFPVILPPGWASKTAWLGQRLLWKRIRWNAKSIDALVVTSPHYLPMLDLVPKNIPVVYYASDDYRSYEGWDSAVAQEEKLLRRVDHTFFVSEGLMIRVRDEYNLDPKKLSVSMNATEERFFSEGNPVDPPSGELKRPIAGVVGGINDRLDFGLLKKCADLPELGSLVLVGPLPDSPLQELKALLDHPKCKAVGRQPHETIHRWFQCLDVGLIPYTETALNNFCSPMRLFDHLASGAPVAATTACDQVKSLKGEVDCCETDEEFVAAVKSSLNKPRADRRPLEITWNDRARKMLSVMEGLKHA